MSTSLSSTQPVDTTSLEEPEVDMEFDSPDAIFSYYRAYAKEKGFAVAKRSSRMGENGKLLDVVYECNKRGKARTRGNNPSKPRPQSKLGCPAHLAAHACPNGKWRLRLVINEHNHGWSPAKVKYLRCNRFISEDVKRRLELNDAAGIRQNKSIDSLQLEAGGFDNLTFTSRDCRNYLAKVRRLNLVEGDAEAMHRYFMKMKSDNSEFFYAMDLDKENRVKNVFWADARSRAASKEFGDVITFDTTYLVNKYDMPFAPFVGVNHHGQSILLGCGLISHEDTASFKWLFETWKTCMWDCAPKAIITDQCLAMKNAIKDVFSQTQHRLCIWHIMKKIPEKFSSNKEYEQISLCMRKVVYDTFSEDEFEFDWQAFVTKYHLEDNDWLKSLYLERKHWVPVYVKKYFWAGMSSTQRSESMHAYFDGYINSKTTLKQFVEQYEIALKKKVEIEKEADASSWNSYIPCMSKDALEKQFHDSYTHGKVREFRDQFCNKLQCQLGEKSGNEVMVREWVYIGEKGEEYKKRVDFKVVFNPETNETNCSCRLFEFAGMVCKHQLTVWNDMGVDKVPDKYILRRWCKNLNRAHTKIRISYDTPTKAPEAKRHESICGLFKEVAYLAKDSKEKYERVMKLGHELKREFEEDLGVCGDNMVHQNDASVPSGNMVDGLDGFYAGDSTMVDLHNDREVCDGSMVDIGKDMDVYHGNVVDIRNDIDDGDGNMVDHLNDLEIDYGNIGDRQKSLVNDNRVDEPNSMVVGDDNMVDYENTLVVCEGNVVDHQNALDDETNTNASCALQDGDTLIRDPKVVRRKGRPPGRRLESHVDKAVKAKKMKFIKQKSKESNKKKQIIQTTKDGNEPQHDLLKVPSTYCYLPQNQASQIYLPQSRASQIYQPSQIYLPQSQASQIYQPQSQASQMYLPQSQASQIHLPQSQALCGGYMTHEYPTHLSVLNSFIWHNDNSGGRRT